MKKTISLALSLGGAGGGLRTPPFFDDVLVMEPALDIKSRTGCSYSGSAGVAEEDTNIKHQFNEDVSG